MAGATEGRSRRGLGGCDRTAHRSVGEFGVTDLAVGATIRGRRSEIDAAFHHDDLVKMVAAVRGTPVTRMLRVRPPRLPDNGRRGGGLSATAAAGDWWL